MGIAILWIMLFHTCGIFVFPKFISLFQTTGNYGVDIFFFVSAYGLFYSMKRPQSLIAWYVRRLKRILPTYFLICTLFGIASGWTLGEFLNEELFIGFLCPWLNWMVEYWYIPSALLFYLIFPFLYKYLAYIEKYIWGVLFISVALFLLVDTVISPIQKYPYIVWFTARIPVFLCGVIYADKEDSLITTIQKNNLLKGAILTVSLLLFVNIITGLISIPYFNAIYEMIFALPIIFTICYMAKKYINIFTPIIEYCGSHSLEIYLLHIAFYKTIPDIEVLEGINSNYTYLCSFVFSIPCAYLLSKTIRTVVK